VAVRGSAWQCVAVAVCGLQDSSSINPGVRLCSVLQCVAVSVAVRCSASQCAVVCCSVLQGVAMHCSASQLLSLVTRQLNYQSECSFVQCDTVRVAVRLAVRIVMRCSMYSVL